MKESYKNELKEFYTTAYFPNSQKWEELTDWQKRVLKNSTMFATWKFSKACESLRNEIYTKLCLEKIANWLNKKLR